MEFTDKVKDVSKKVGDVAASTYKTVADKSNQMIKNAKLKMQISEIEEEIALMYSDFGKRIYKSYEEGIVVEGFEKECKKIEKMFKEIDTLETKGLQNKNLRKCAGCGETIPLDSKFCPTCGEKQKKIKVASEEKEDEAPIVKVCPECGTEFGPEVNFCTKCGVKLN